MPQEIEAKIAVQSHDAARAKLASLEAVRVGRVLELNTFFDTDDRKLLSLDSGLRLRGNSPLDGSAPTFIVTFKGPKAPGPIKRREEIEIIVDDEAAATLLFERLSYRPILGFEKRRETFRLGGCLVELDALPYLGRFVEIEGPDEAAIAAVRTQLGLDQEPLISTGYAAMIARWRDEHAPGLAVIRFSQSQP